MIVELHPVNPNPRTLSKVCDVLHKDGIVIVPTDTIYAMACKLESKKAIDRMARIAGKKTDRIHFSLLCADLSHISQYTGLLDKQVFRLMKNNLPGPFTFILPANKQVTKWFDGNKKTIGIRVPDTIIVQSLVQTLGSPLVVSTIHHSDTIVQYMSDPNEIHEQFKHKVDLVIDGGTGGIEPSTIIDCSTNEPLIIREGKGILRG